MISKVFVSLFLVLMFTASACDRVPPPQEASYEKMTWYVDAARFQKSVHGAMRCTACHREGEFTKSDYPHDKKLTRAKVYEYDWKFCARCHPQEYGYFSKGEHAKAKLEELKGRLDKEKDYRAPVCKDCHPPHYIMVK